jgi:ABC-type antimicrobial peptide transport system permease subunit
MGLKIGTHTLPVPAFSPARFRTTIFNRRRNYCHEVFVTSHTGPPNASLDLVANRRFEMQLLLLFAVSALLLAGLRVYGVVTYSVVQREREIGLRLALGAQRKNIYSLVLRDGLAPVLAGAAAGIALAFASARVVSSLLFQVSPYDSALALSAVCVLLATSTAACLLPARRAASVDPMQMLRRE